MDKALRILDDGRGIRSGVEQVLWLMTDYHEIKGHYKVLETAGQLKQYDVDIFGFGDGSNHNDIEIDLLQQIVSRPTHCYYVNEDDHEFVPAEWTFVEPESECIFCQNYNTSSR